MKPVRLPERLEAERESEADGLSAYLEDPLKFFVPARLLRGILLILAVADRPHKGAALKT